MLAFVVFVMGFAATAGAQDRVAVTVAAGVIANASPAPAEDFAEPTYMFSVQRVIKEHFALDGEVDYWAHTSSSDQGPHDISGPSGVIGHVTGANQTSDNTYWNFGLNFLVRSTGRVRVFGGAGVGFVMQNEIYSQQAFGCSAGLDPRTCSRYENTYNRGPLPLFRALGGVEAPVTKLIAITSSVRYEDSSYESTNRNVSALAGVRFALK